MKPETIAKVKPWLEAAVPHLHGTHTLDDVIKAFTEGNCTLWVGRSCFAITEFHSHPQCRVLHIFLAGGERGPAMLERSQLQPGIEAFARAGGASRITFMGRLTRAAQRNGWTKGCSDFGPPTHGFFVKELEP